MGSDQSRKPNCEKNREQSRKQNLPHVRRIHEEPHVSIEFKTVFDLAPDESGWKVKIGDKDKLKDLMKKKIVTLGVLGSYDAGKTYLCNLLGSKNLRSGYEYTTTGIQACYPENENIHFGIIDVPGSQEALPVNDSELAAKLPLKKPKDNTQICEDSTGDYQNVSHLNRFNFLHSDAKLTHSLKEKFIVENVDIIILVTNKLSASDQEMIYKNINNYRQACERKKIGAQKYLYIVHNFKMLTTIDAVENQIEKDIIKCFDVEKTSIFNMEKDPGLNSTMYQDSFGISHLVLANDASPAGKFYNPSTINFLKGRIRSTETKATLNLIEAFQNFCNENLKKMLGQDIQIAFDEGKSALVNKNSTKIKIDALAWTSLGELILMDSKFTPKYSITTCDLDSKTQKVTIDVETMDCVVGEQKPGKSYTRYRLVTEDGIVSLKLKGEKIVAKEPDIEEDSKEGNLKTPEGTMINHSRGEGEFELSIKMVKDKREIKKEITDLKNGITRFEITFSDANEPWSGK